MDVPDELTQTIMRYLEIDRQYITDCLPSEAERIAAIRSAGRKAGRQLGLKIVTHQTDPAQRNDGRVVVLVIANEGSDSEDSQRLAERSQLLLNETFKDFRI